MSNELIQNNLNFESIKHIDDNGNEFWYARELQVALEYTEWRKFEGAINKAIAACKNSDIEVYDHFVGVAKTVISGVAPKEIDDYKLSRYACYLIMQNADSRKRTVALGQTYFAVQTRKQEQLEEMTEDTKRLFARGQVSEHNKKLFSTAKDSGVRNYGRFNNSGYQGLYNGLTEKQIHLNKKLKEKDSILDNMSSEELAANLFRITQTDSKLKNSNISNEDSACKVHLDVGKKVRKAIEDIGGTMPEKLPTPEKSIKQIAKEKKITEKLDNKKNKLLN